MITKEEIKNADRCPEGCSSTSKCEGCKYINEYECRPARIADNLNIYVKKHSLAYGSSDNIFMDTVSINNLREAILLFDDFKYAKAEITLSDCIKYIEINGVRFKRIEDNE